jgi:arginine/lysine/ornithine decarboxylase
MGGEGIAKECHERGVLLIVDNAHGAYLKFLSPSRHPIDLGADICCDSAHKTLSALTGCGYLHIRKNLPSFFKDRVKSAMMLFASTSPSYLMLASLDALNRDLKVGYAENLRDFVEKLNLLKRELISHGYELVGDEPMKLTVFAKSFGYTGKALADILSKEKIYTEFSDEDYLVLMPSPKNSDEDLKRLKQTLLAIPKKEKNGTAAPQSHIPKKAISIRDAVLSVSELLPVRECIGRIAATVTASCPPAIPIAVSGEIIDEKTVKAFEYYGIYECSVIKK